MGLFDNIFLDQNTATAMMEPLMTTEQKEAAAKAEKEAAEAAAMPLPAVTEDTVAPVSDADISFDIGGIDLPDFDAATAEPTPESTSSPEGGMFLSGGKVLSASESTAATDEVSLDADVSIGLLQGATAGSSDAIMDSIVSPSLDVTPETEVVSSETTGEVAIQADTESVTPITISDSETLVKMEEIPPTELQMDNVFAAGSSLMDMLGTVDTEVPTATTATTETTEVTSSLITPEATPDTTASAMSAEDVSSETSLFSEAVIDDSAILAAVAGAPVDENSPLHEMLREFITKLEKLENESETLDAKTMAAVSRLQTRRIKLEDEYHARLSAIEKEQQHISEGKFARQEEKTKLRKIIENLQKEIA